MSLGTTKNETRTKAKRSISREKVWQKYYAPESLASPLPKMKTYDFLKFVNAGREGDIALNYYGAKTTYAQLYERIDECANAFAALGLKQGDTVSLLTVALPETIIACYALNKIGVTANAVDPRMDTESVKRMIAGAGSDIIISVDLAFPRAKRIMDELDQKLIIVQSPARSLPPIKKLAMTIASKAKVEYSDKVIKWDDFLAKGKGLQAQEAPYVGDATVAITYTGGTTNFPKGVMLTNDGINAVAFGFQHAGLYYNRNDSFLGIIPPFTAYGFVCGVHMPLCMGCELIPIPKFDATQFGKLVKQFKPNHMISTPAFYEMLMQSKEVQNLDLSFMITLGSGGDTMNEGVEAKLRQFMRDRGMTYPLAQGYGMSELSAAATWSVNDIFKPGSVGIPAITNTVSIFHSETGEELSYNEEGEICVTGPTMMKGYFNQPHETAKVMRMHDDGQVWIHSGDIGYMDEDGFLFIKGRSKRMITRFDGHKIYPSNVEGIVAEDPLVFNCSVIGVNDMDFSQGQYPLILVEFVDCVDRQAACEKIYASCMERLEERGRPVAVVSVDKIPLTGMGKNDYRTLEDEYANFNYKAWQKALQQ